MRTPVMMATVMGGGGLAQYVTYVTAQTNLSILFPFDDTAGTTARTINAAKATGRNILKNGGFTSADYWTINDGSITIAGNKLNFIAGVSGKSAIQDYTSHSLPLYVGKTYKVTYTIVSYVTGTVRIYVGAGASFNCQTAPGTYTSADITCTGTTQFIIMAIGAGGTTAAITDISVNRSGIVANELNGEAGAITGAAINQIAAGAQRLKGYAFSGGDDRVNIYSKQFNDLFDPTLITISMFIKAATAATWWDVSSRYIAHFRGVVDASNVVYVLADGAGGILISYVGSGTVKTVRVSANSANLFCLHIVIDKASDDFIVYLNGSQYGVTRTALGLWNDNLLYRCAIIANQFNDVGTGFNGFIGPVAFFNEARSAANCLLDAQAGGAIIGDIGMAADSTADLVACDGDSLTQGAGVGVTRPYPSVLCELLTNYEILNSGVGSESADTLAATVAAVIDPLFEAARTKNIYVLCTGIIDVVAGTASAAILTDIWAICDGRQTAGWEVIVCNLTPVNGLAAAKETVRGEVNADIATNWAAHADAYVDFAGNEFLDDPADATYYVDGTHNTNAGYAVRAALVKAAIDTL